MGTYLQDLADLQDDRPAPPVAPLTRSWRLEFDCQGSLFIWTGQADTEREAINLARRSIYMQGDHDQDAAQLVACVERRP